MEELLKELYEREVETFALHFEDDPEYQEYYTRAQALWEGEDMPEAIFQLLDTSDRIAFVHGSRMGLALTKWAEGAWRMQNEKCRMQDGREGA